MNTISNLWNGRFGLAKTYWLWGVLSGIPWGIALSLVKPGSNLAILVVLAVFVYYVIVHFGIWRAASEYEGAKAWAILAKIAVAITPACLVIGTLAAVIIPAKHQLSTQGQQTTPAPLGKPSNPTVSSTLPPCREGETRIAGESQCRPWSDFTPVKPEPPQPSAPSAQEVHMQKIYAAHPDANEIYRSTEFGRWLIRTPKFKHVPTDGTTQEVIDMFSAFKRRSKVENQRLDQKIDRRNEAAAEALSRQYAPAYPR